MVALSCFYGQHPRKLQASNDLFHLWNDGGPPHLLQWTCIFVCPLSGELFLAKEWPDSGPATVDHNGIHFLKQKTLAKHGAAALAYDCHMLRKQQEEPDGPKYGCIGSSEPYLESDAIYDMPDAVPQVIRDLIQAQQGEA